MTNKRQRDAWQQEQQLGNAGYDIQGRQCVRLHSGNETLRHRCAKMCAAHVLAEEGYRVDSEVEQTDGPIADILAFGHEDRKPVVVELESNCSPSLRKKNAKKYAKGIVYDCLTIDVAELSDDIETMTEQIRSEVIR